MVRAGQIIALCVLALLSLGVIMVTSAEMQVRRVDALTPAAALPTASGILTSRPAVYMLVAMCALGVAACVPVRRIAAWIDPPASDHDHATPITTRPMAGWPVLLAGTIALLGVCALVYVPGLSREVNGSHRWINLPGLSEAQSLQPSEIAKWGAIAMIAWYCARAGSRVASFWKGLLPALAAVGLLAAFIVVEDLGTGALVAAVAGVLLLAAGARWWHFALLAPAPLAAIAYAIATSDYRVNRILAFLDPYKDAEGIGYHTVQSLIAVAHGGGTGVGLGNGLQKLGYLPEDRTDFLFAIICEELGIAGAGLVIVLLTTIVWAGVRIASRESSPFLRLVALGVTTTIALQAIINLSVVTAVAPTKGIALPLLSAGGTGWILTACCLGVVIAIDRTHPRTHPRSQTRMLQSAPEDVPQGLPA